MAWNIATAKQQFSEVVRLTAEEPQAIYNRDKPVAVLISAQDFEQFKQWQAQRKRPTLSELFAEIRTILAAEGDSQWNFFAGNYQEYEEDKRKRLGEEGAKPKRIRYKPITR